MDNTANDRKRRRTSGMSYKFQRLRERLRTSVANGELTGKLPGERELARRFHVNAKTLSKALTDLAAEGLLHRSIGRGTYVKGHEPIEDSQGTWLALTDSSTNEEIVAQLKLAHPQLDVIDSMTRIRPSFLNQFTAVIDLALDTPEAFIRDLLVRNIPVLAFGRPSRTYSVNAVLIDRTLSATYLARDLILNGHRRFLAVEPRNRNEISEAIRRAGARFGDSISVDACAPGEVLCSLEYGITACVCDSAVAARQALEVFRKSNVSIPGQMSVTAVGCAGDNQPCTGYYIGIPQCVNAIVEMLKSGQNGRPTVLWLNGQRFEAGTTTLIQPEGPSDPIAQFPPFQLATHAVVG